MTPYISAPYTTCQNVPRLSSFSCHKSPDDYADKGRCPITVLSIMYVGIMYLLQLLHILYGAYVGTPAKREEDTVNKHE